MRGCGLLPDLFLGLSTFPGTLPTRLQCLKWGTRADGLLPGELDVEAVASRRWSGFLDYGNTAKHRSGRMMAPSQGGAWVLIYTRYCRRRGPSALPRESSESKVDFDWFKIPVFSCIFSSARRCCRHSPALPHLLRVGKANSERYWPASLSRACCPALTVRRRKPLAGSADPALSGTTQRSGAQRACQGSATTWSSVNLAP